MNLDDVKDLIDFQKKVYMNRMLTEDDDFNTKFRFYCIGIFDAFQLSKGINPPKELLSKHEDSEVFELDTFIWRCGVELAREHMYKDQAERIINNITKESKL